MKVIFIVGATASGKTGLVHNLIDDYFKDAYIISADSMQIYEHMIIGTAAPTDLELKKYKYKMTRCISPLVNFSVSDYVSICSRHLKKLNNSVVFVVGGTGLYINALKYGIFDEIDDNGATRNKLYDRLERGGLSPLLIELDKLDKNALNEVDRNNPRRVIRALEICLKMNIKFSDIKKARKPIIPIEYLTFGVSESRDILYERINERVIHMINNGLVDEVEKLKGIGVKRGLTSMQGIGYKEVFSYLDNEIDKDELISLIQRNTRRYAKRQLTWFSRDDIDWVNRLDFDNIAKKITSFYNK